MKTSAKCWLAIALFAVAFGVSAKAAPAAPPAKSAVKFRRDRLPLDVDAIIFLSQKLVTLAQSSPKTPAGRQASKQLLSLSLALNPGNAAAEDMLAACAENKPLPSVDAGEVAQSKNRVEKFIAWLQSPDVEEQGGSLAVCLKKAIEPIAVSKSNEQLASQDNGESEISDQLSSSSLPDKNDGINSNSATEERPTLVNTASIGTVLWRNESFWNNSPEPSFNFVSSTLDMSAQKVPPHRGKVFPFTLEIGAAWERESFKPLRLEVENLLRKQHPKLPDGLLISINGSEFQMAIRSCREQPIFAQIAILANAALTKSDPTGIVIGKMDKKGNFGISDHFWRQLRSLGPGKGERLILPAEAASMLPAMLTLGKPEFFLQYEVVYAANFEELLALTSSKPEGSSASAMTTFRTVYDRSKGVPSLPAFIANPFVQKRLQSIVQDMPNHASAKMLTLQAKGPLPPFSRQMLSAEIQGLLQPVDKILKMTPEIIEKTRFDDIAEQWRTSLDFLASRTSKSDQDLIEKSRRIRSAISSLNNAAKATGEKNARRKSIQSNLDYLSMHYKKLSVELSALEN